MLNRYNTLAPNVVRGGTAIPLGNNFYYMKGRKHKNGGIDIGENPRTGLEVEGGEVMEMRPNEVRVYSSVPFLRGVSPAKLVLGGANPNAVFNAQEQYKNKNKLKDDGTKYKNGGNKLNNIQYIIEKINNSDKDFAKRLKQNNRQYIKDWEIPGAIATHKLSVGTDKNGNDYIYPEVQNINGKLYDFTNPKYKHNKWDAQLSAEEKGDTIRINNIQDGIDFTTNYKNLNIYPKFNYGGNMIASINGNVKNGLIHTEMKYSDRKKALLGKEETLDFIDRTPTRLNVTATPNINKITLPASLQNASRNYSTNLSLPLQGVRTEDWISLASNIGSTLAGSLIGANAIIKAPELPEVTTPTLVTPGNLKTYININPQLSTVRLNTLARMADTDRNTASSRTALARKQRLANQAVYDINNLYGQKENIETELYNKNVLNKQAVAAQNAQIYNKYLTDKLNRDIEQVKLKYAADAENTRNKAVVYNNLLSGTNASIQDLITRLEQRRKDRNTLSAVAARSKDAATFLKTLNLFE